jgi:DNA-binding winged helix-turn-helix (wHTH) protein
VGELWHFDRFVLDADDRQLRADGAPVELSGRYLDALVLMVRDAGRLVPKDRFMSEVWRGVPVTDEALTQCIRALRKALGDEAGRPRFIETVPKHGYRFIGVVADDEAAVPSGAVASEPMGRLKRVALLGGAGALGGLVSGVVGGVIYGFASAAQPGSGVGAASVLVVVLCLCVAVAVAGALAVGLGIAAAEVIAPGRRAWAIAGGAWGGLVVGAVVKLIGTDAFNLLFGHAPGAITGAGEGAVLGGGVGLAAWAAGRVTGSTARRSAIAALVGAATGAAITLLGGRMMAGSLDLLARDFPEGRLRLDPIGQMFGEQGLGPVALVATGAMEGGLFAGCVVAAMLWARAALDGGSTPPGSPR